MDLLPYETSENYKKIKQPFRCSENDPKDIQQMKKYLFNKIYKNSVRKVNVCCV